MYFSVPLARSRFHSHLTMYTFCIIVVDVRVAVNSVFIVAMGMKQFVPLAVISSYKVCRTSVTDIHLLRFSCKVTDIFVRL